MPVIIASPTKHRNCPRLTRSCHARENAAENFPSILAQLFLGQELGNTVVQASIGYKDSLLGPVAKREVGGGAARKELLQYKFMFG
jgi:hypothetical protein